MATPAVLGAADVKGTCKGFQDCSESGINLDHPKIAGIALETALQGLRDEESTYTSKLKLQVK